MKEDVNASRMPAVARVPEAPAGFEAGSVSVVAIWPLFPSSPNSPF